jgi:hypothetical protein
MPARKQMARIAAIQHRVRSKGFELPALIAIAVAGAAIAFGILSVGGLPENGSVPLPKHTRLHLGTHFRESGEFHMWLFLIVAQTAFWAIAAAVLLAPEMWRPLADLWPKARKTVVASVIAAGAPLVGIVVVASLYSHLDYPLPEHKWKVVALSLIGAAVALVGIAELALVKFALQHGPPGRGKSVDIDRYLALREQLQRVLAIEGGIIGAAVLTTGALRNAVVAYTPSLADFIANNRAFAHDHNIHASTFPREYVLIYGAFFTLLLALLYAPVYFRLLEVGREHVNAACKAEEPDSEAWLPAYEKRKKLEELLQLEVTTSAGFRSGVAILTPLGSALVALLLGAA